MKKSGWRKFEKTIQELKPKEDIICLYVRFARQLPSNFHVDSMATVLCVAKQCNYLPYKFLNNVQTLLVCHSTSSYKLSFWFKASRDKKMIENKFVGLSLTMKLLKTTISKSCANLGKVGMCQKGARTPIDLQVPIGQNETLDAKIKAPIEFHKQKSLQVRLWQCINHRWLAFALVELLFNHDEFYNWTVKQCFLFSVQAFAACGASRYDFLDLLTGFCLRFTTQDEINANRNNLQKIWDCPSDFILHGNNYLREKSNTTRTKLIVECFTNLKQSLTRKTQYTRWLPFDLRLQMLRAYTFQFWLEKTANNSIKSAVTGTISPEARQTKCGKSKISVYEKAMIVKPPDPPPKKPRRLMNVNGMHSLINSRQNLLLPSLPNPKKCHEVSLMNTEGCCSLKTFTKSAWKSMNLMSKAQLDVLVSSHLIIKTDACIDIVARLSPFEVYSADNLKDYSHLRVHGSPGHVPYDMVGQVVLQVGSDLNQFIGTNGFSMFHVARDGSSFFKEHGHILPTIEDCSILCMTIAKFGSIDEKRSPGQYRVFIGNGGQNRPNGIPALLVDNGFEKNMRSDPDTDADSFFIRHWKQCCLDQVKCSP